jgi:hypothetical protein
MRLLLDTQLLVWAMGSPQRLPAGLAPMLEDPSHPPIFSVQPAVLRRVLLDDGRSLCCRPFIVIRSTVCCLLRPASRVCC